VVILEKTAEALPTLDRCRPAPRQFLGTRGAEEYLVLVKNDVPRMLVKEIFPTGAVI
jgi:hypothetical protein